MKIDSVLIAGQDPLARTAALSAAQLAYPLAQVTQVPGLAEAKLAEPLPLREILVLLSPSPREVEMAEQTRDRRGLRRWPVVVFGPDPGAKPGAQSLTEAVLRHQLLRENERLRGDLRTVGRRLNHDLRTPLNCVVNAGAEPENSGALQSSVAEIVRMMERVSFVLRATADPPPAQAVAMGDIVTAALDRLEGRRQKQGATIIRPESWPSVEGVPAWLEVIWWNLIGNSLDHGGSATRIVLGWMPTSREYRFWVRDNGPGVSLEKRGRLFEPFDLLHELNSPRGLGLPIVQRLVELQGGRCGYEFPPGGGCTLSFTLPAG